VQTRTVLAVDDSTQLLGFIADALHELGNYRVVVAQDGEEGLDRCLELHPDGVMVDVMMPGLDGYQLVKALRGDPKTADIPIIILSALVQEIDQLIGLLAGADQYLLKPVDPLNLVEAIERSIARSQEERRHRLRELSGIDHL
jgi:two-component system, OmpR family, alkaline phosphatase synthesis response regulator PhoP